MPPELAIPTAATTPPAGVNCLTVHSLENVQALAQKLEPPRRSAAQNATSHLRQGPDLPLPMSVPHLSATTTVGMPEFEAQLQLRASLR